MPISATEREEKERGGRERTLLPSYREKRKRADFPPLPVFLKTCTAHVFQALLA